MSLSHNKLYRNFIILQEDERGYSASSDKALSGYAKVEAKGDKCKISFYAQNLKPEDNYSMVLICCKKDSKQLIDLGPLTINEVGKGDTSKEYYINNIAGLGLSYEKISGAAICKTKDGENGYVMHGFMNGEESSENWRKFRLVKADGKRTESKLDLPPKKIDTSKVDDRTIDKPADLQTQLPKTEVKMSVSMSEQEPKVSNSKKEEFSNIEVTSKREAISEFNEAAPPKKEEIHELEVKVEPKVETKIVNEVRNDEFDCENQEKENIEFKPLENRIQSSFDYLSEEPRKLRNALFMEDEFDENIREFEMSLENTRHKKCEKDKYDKCDKCKEEKKDKEKHKDKDDIEEYFEKIGEMLEDYEEYLDIDIKAIEGDFIIYGVIKDKNDSKCKWKKFKVNKHCCEKKYGMMNQKPYSSKRIEENTRLDINDFDEYEKNIEKVKKPDKFSLSGEEGRYFEKIAQDFEPYTKGLSDINYCKWYKVDVNGIDDLCNESNHDKYTLAYYPMLNYYPYISKNKHFLLGYKCNDKGQLKYIVYGIPGSKDKAEQPYGGKTGFVTWTNENGGKQGYWLMFYDFKNSTIVVPMK